MIQPHSAKRQRKHCVTDAYMRVGRLIEKRTDSQLIARIIRLTRTEITLCVEDRGESTMERGDIFTVNWTDLHKYRTCDERRLRETYMDNIKGRVQ